jgi:hydrogenase maturation protease
VSGGQTGRTLVACLGNIFLSDDGFGVEVARRLARYELPDGVRVTDYGIRGMHLAYDLSEGFDSTILVDATQRGGKPGTVYLIEPEAGAGPWPTEPASARSADQGDPASARSADQGDPGGRPPGLELLSLLNAHGMQPDLVLSLAGTLGADAGRVLVVGCEPATLEEGIGLSAPVAAAVDDAVRMVTRLVEVPAQGDDSPEPPEPPRQETDANPESMKG